MERQQEQHHSINAQEAVMAPETAAAERALLEQISRESQADIDPRQKETMARIVEALTLGFTTHGKPLTKN